MKTIDQALISIVNHPQIEQFLLKEDIKAFRGLVSTIKHHVFLTEGQSKFCIELMIKTVSVLRQVEPEIREIIGNNTWSKPFRNIEIIKKISINEDKQILIESNYSNSFRSLMMNLGKSILITPIVNGKEYVTTLTEKSIVELVDNLKPLGFDISDEILEYYDTICSWNAREVSEKFSLTNIADEDARTYIMNDIGVDTPINSLIIADRRLRYQYQIDNSFYNEVNDTHSLTEIIAKRLKTRLWIDNTKYSLTELVSSLRELNRLPILFIFDNSNIDKAFSILESISDALSVNGINDKIGIYFRLDNVTGKQFNTFIADNNYNARMDRELKVAGITNNNLPKFFLKSEWEPMSIISLGNGLRNSKTSVYASCCDLIITYSKDEPFNSFKW